MRIQHNIMAMNAYRNYSNNTSSLSSNLEKLSSGYKINRAGDDAAGLAISEKMRAQITGLDQAADNVKDGISLVKTAEGALQEVQDMLNRMVELATQSANGTYEDSVDRKNLQSEVDALESEINRIADSANFNGISLLDGSLSAADGVTIGAVTTTKVDAKLTSDIGTVDTKVDGVLSAGVAGSDYQEGFYFGDIKNSNAAAKNIVVTYNDNTGTAKTVSLAVAAGKTVTASAIAAALNGTSGTAVGDITPTDTGTAITGTTDGGQFAQLYEAKASGNIITITAKADESKVSTSSVNIDGSNLGTISVNITAFDADDQSDAIANLKSNYTNAGATNIAYGSSAGDAIGYVAATDSVYTVASAVLTLSGTTGKDMNNQGFTVGDTTYVIQSGTSDIKGVPTGAEVVHVEDADTAQKVAAKLAAAITAKEGSNGNYTAAADTTAGKLTIRESTNYGQNVIDGASGFTAGKGADLIKLENFTTAAATSTASSDVTLDASKVVNGTVITVGDKKYMLTDDADMAALAGTTKVTYTKGDSNDMAAKLAAQLTTDGFTGVASSGAKVTFTNSLDAKGNGFEISAKGAGLKLQIGDTSDSFNQLGVTIGDMHVAGIGIDKISIATAEDAQAAVSVIKDAINTVSSTRGDLGAIQNRLEHTSNNLSVMSENIQDAESTIRDTDIAEEMMAYTKNNILVQSAQAMLAQANQVPQGVLQLLQ
jgi:flagellin